MFFEFTSEHEYPESDWPSVWEIEVHIFGCLMADYEVVRRAEADALADLLRKELRDVVQSNEVARAGEWTDDFVKGYLEQQVPPIHEFLRNTPNPDGAGLRIGVFRQCLRDSPAFSMLIREDEEQ